MSRYIVSNLLHYIGGVDQFDVLFSTYAEFYAIKWAVSYGSKVVTKHTMQQPQRLQSECQGIGMTAEQAERICLLVKLFGPQETA